jgi:hypothetical protein
MLAASIASIAATPVFAQTAQTAQSGSESLGQAAINQYSYGSNIPNNTPGLGAMYATPTASCMSSNGISGVGPGAGGQIMWSSRDQVCTWEGKVSMAYNTRQPDVARTEWCLNDPDYRTANAILGKPCNYRTYPKDQQAQAEKDQIAAGFLNADGTPKILQAATTPRAVSSHDAFCATLDPTKKEDRPYIAQCIGGK